MTLLESNFAALPRLAARCLLAFLALLMIYGVSVSFRPVRTAPVKPIPAAHKDSELYRAVADRIAKGENYYTAAITEHRARGFPLRPFVTVRPPLLAYATAYLGSEAMVWLLRALALSTFMALAFRLMPVLPEVRHKAVTLSIAASSIIILIAPVMAVLHDVWASLLIVLSLALYRPNRYMVSIGLGLLAALLRELTIPYLLAMGFCALCERCHKEAAIWAVSMGIAGVALAIHAHNIALVINAHDLASQGWSKLGGWPFILTMLRMGSVVGAVPASVSACLIPLSLLGWIGWEHPFARRVSLWLCGMTGLFMIAGRPDNFYWGLYLVCYLPMGIAFAPDALIRLFRAARYN